jgi:hypothetical protein
MGNRYQLRDRQGNDLGETEYSFVPSPGDEIYTHGATKMRVTAVISEEVASEFVNAPVYGILEVEPLD